VRDLATSSFAFAAEHNLQAITGWRPRRVRGEEEAGNGRWDGGSEAQRGGAEVNPALLGSVNTPRVYQPIVFICSAPPNARTNEANVVTARDLAAWLKARKYDERSAVITRSLAETMTEGSWSSLRGRIVRVAP
jgi:hypothetical protein